MKFENKGLTYSVLYSEEDSQKISNKFKLNVSGSGYIEVDKRDQSVVLFHFDDTPDADSDDHIKMCKIFSKLYYKVYQR